MSSLMTEDYHTFLRSKRARAESFGHEVRPDQLHPSLFPFQRDIVRWALRKGRAALFAGCGMGKTICQLDWSRHVHDHTGGDVLILAPLAVSKQTAREGDKFGLPVTICRSQSDVRPGINVTNYEMLGHFEASAFSGMVIDESSILKGYDGVFRQQVTNFGRSIGYRLACTATPSPNDLVEISNHAEFLDVMTGKEILALFFIQDGNSTHQWRLKGHAREEFWRWMASWAVAVRKPSDLGYEDGSFILPPLSIYQVTVDAKATCGYLFAVEALGLMERREARRNSLDARVAACAQLVNGSSEPWLVWCDLNCESEALAKAIPGSVEVRGGDSTDHKERAVLDFIGGRSRVLVSKPSIFGHGMNLQHCARMAFVGLSDSFESFYQAVRRCWRFGQQWPVEGYLITSEAEGAVVKNIERKEHQHDGMMDNLVKHMAVHALGRTERGVMEMLQDCKTGRHWTMYQGDSVEILGQIKAESVGLTMFSPPFPSMYTYTNSPRDMGNVQGIEEMIAQFAYLVPELLRVSMPGRDCCIHLTQAVAFKGKEGYIGMKDFRGAVIQTMEKGGWHYYGEVTIDKNPQVKAARTKEATLLFKTLAEDSGKVRPAMADYLVIFRKPGENPRPIRAGIVPRYGSKGNVGTGWITTEEWIEWAAPVWYRQTAQYPGGIRETDVLNVSNARESEDERHLCPLQLGVIERAVKLWSAPGDLVLDPFAGIGSTGYQSLLLHRCFVGVELKPSYFETACRNLERADLKAGAANLFDMAKTQESEEA